MPPLDLAQVLADAQRQRLQPSPGPTGLQWFVDLRFAEPEWFQDRARVRALVDGLAAAAWFREFDVFARDHQPGAAIGSLDAVRDAIASGETGNAIFARGEPRMTVDIDQAEAALSIDVNVGRVELRLWLAAAAVTRLGAAALDDMIGFVLAWRATVPDVLVANALAFPRPTDGLPYRRTRPLRIANRALDAVVDVVDRTAPSAGPLWGPDSLAMAAAPVPATAERIERGDLVVVRWVRDPSDLVAMAEACSRHEQWLIPLVPTRIAPGWNAAGDLHVPIRRPTPTPAPLSALDLPTGDGFVDLDDAPDWAAVRAAARAKRLRSGTAIKSVSAVATDRAQALAVAAAAREAGCARVLYRDAKGERWDPFPPGSWV